MTEKINILDKIGHLLHHESITCNVCKKPKSEIRPVTKTKKHTTLTEAQIKLLEERKENLISEKNLTLILGIIFGVTFFIFLFLWGMGIFTFILFIVLFMIIGFERISREKELHEIEFKLVGETK